MRVVTELIGGIVLMLIFAYGVYKIVNWETSNGDTPNPPATPPSNPTEE